MNDIADLLETTHGIYLEKILGLTRTGTLFKHRRTPLTVTMSQSTTMRQEQ